MREIKFRAWDGKSMLPVGTSGVCLIPSEDGTWYEEYDMNADREWGSPIMQYTGLTDKNGVEIYEGDILQAKSVTGHEYIPVRFDKGGFIVRNREGYPTALSDFLDVFGCEVIGNIYENPDLLEQAS